MTTVTHVVVTALGVQALGLHGSDAALAWAFGVGIDVDHVIKLPFYYKAIGKKRQLGYYWRTSLQEPVALLWILPLCWFFKTPVPLVFFVVHIAMDYSVRFEKMPWYPYSPAVTRGWLVNVSDRTKELVVLGVALCLNLLLYLARH